MGLPSQHALAGVSAIALIMTAPSVQAQVGASAEAAHAATDAEMMALIRKQAARIEELESRLDKLENRPVAEAGTPPPGTPVIAIPELAFARSQSHTQPPVGSIPPGKPLDLSVTWGAGAPIFAKSDGSFTFKPRGRLLMDLDSTFGSRIGSRNVTTTGLRGGRLGVEGTFLHHGFYQFEADFAEGDIGIVGAFIGYQDKIGKIEFDARIGNMFNDRSLEGQSGSLTTPFIERNFVANAILPQKGFYGMGTMLRVFGPRWHASLAITGDPIDGAYATDDTMGIASRVHWNPVKTEDVTLHLGAWGFHEELSDSARTITRNTAIGARFDSTLRVSTGPLTDANRSIGYGAEVAGIYRNVYAWGEYGRRDLRFLPSSPTKDFATDAWSLSAGWFLTGEKAPYSGRQGNFLAPKILHSLAEGGSGAFELLVRHERLDYSRTPLGGTGEESTIGLNWYPVPLVRFMLNWSHWTTNNRVAPAISKDTGDSITTRAQFNF